MPLLEVFCMSVCIKMFFKTTFNLHYAKFQFIFPNSTFENVQKLQFCKQLATWIQSQKMNHNLILNGVYLLYVVI